MMTATGIISRRFLKTHSHQTEYFSNSGDRNEHHFLALLSICLKKSPHLPRTLGCPCTLSLLLDLFRKREKWCSATALLAVTANKMLMHLGHAAAQMLREKKAPGSPFCSHSVLLGFDDLTTTGRSFSPSLKHFQSRKSLEDPLHTLQSVCEDGAAGLQESLPGVGIATLQRMRQYTTLQGWFLVFCFIWKRHPFLGNRKQLEWTSSQHQSSCNRNQFCRNTSFWTYWQNFGVMKNEVALPKNC